MLGQARLMTLLGMGGLGKTRLSLQVAAEQLPLYPDGVWFLDLSPLRDAALRGRPRPRACWTCAEEPGRPMLQTLCAHLKAKRAAADPGQLRAPDQARRRLGARDREERAQRAHDRFQPRAAACAGRADLPDPAAAGARAKNASLQALQRSTAGALFVQRAQAHKPTFELNEREAAGRCRTGSAAGGHPAGA